MITMVNFKEELEEIDIALRTNWKPRPIQKVSILRDRLKWSYQGDQWEWTFDAGVKISVGDNDLLVVAKDSSIGIMEFWLGSNIDWIHDRDKIGDLYFFEPNELKEIWREEIVLKTPESYWVR
ncbi:hypothetical protein [Paludifilum halophilum]|uniref:Uncharacterized protein n=1 Tax=Paludifilum halophilum TaxID=1642702 RepID=A0A235B1R2_9BACL|nr:hypothetical protein [Paludifilum halophilum]OYD06223.1 hypothetical protein CHM34_17335 [Paludifilum halophilum]